MNMAMVAFLRRKAGRARPSCHSGGLFRARQGTSVSSLWLVLDSGPSLGLRLGPSPGVVFPAALPVLFCTDFAHSLVGNGRFHTVPAQAKFLSSLPFPVCFSSLGLLAFGALLTKAFVLLAGFERG